jgi:hypothetical protein
MKLTMDRARMVKLLFTEGDEEGLERLIEGIEQL